MNTHDNWLPFHRCSFKLANDVHVWKFSLDLPEAILNELLTVLSPEELQRARRFRFDRHRKAFIAAHGQMRLLLARYLQCKPDRFRFAQNEHGKPFLPGSNLEFNLSHSKQMGLLAVNRTDPLGVDVEWKRPDFGGLKIARRFFSPREVAELEQLPPEHHLDAFFNGWTRKEAYIKALGKGLAIPLGKFSVTLAPGKPAQLLSTEHDPEQKERWKLINLIVGYDYAGALLVSKQKSELFLFEIDQTNVDKLLLT